MAKLVTSRTISMKLLADKFNEQLPRYPYVYDFHSARRVFVEKKAGIYKHTIAELKAKYP